MLEQADYVFYFLAFVTFFAALFMVATQNPIYCALCLALSMLGVAGLFVTLNAVFLAAVQLIVYAGAVMVLFVMVIMLFDIKHDLPTFSKGSVSGLLKLVSSGMILGLIIGSVYMSAEMVFNPQPEPTTQAVAVDATRALANTLFTKYIFGFEVIGFLLLVIAIGAVTLSRIEGGTHHANE